MLLLIAGASFFFTRIGDLETGSRTTRSSAALDEAKQALVGWATTYRDRSPTEMYGFLPCPDTNNDGFAEANCGASGDVVIGRLPYKTLGLAAPRDATGECLWYAVGNFKNSTKSVPMNWDVPGHFRIVDLDGKELAKPDDGFGGAAAVVFAPGAPLSAQNRPVGALECSGDATNSFAAYLDGGYVSPSAASLAAPYVVTVGRTALNDANNDKLAWITPQELFGQRIKLRKDFQAGINAMNGNVQACLQSTMPVPTAIPGLPNPGDKLVGRVPVACASALPTDYYNNFFDQLFYARCNVVGSRCLTVNGSTCDGVLLFSGERAAGQTRLTVAQKDTPGNYLEGSNLTNFLNVGTNFVGATSFAATTGAPASTDVALCLVQELSFANDMARLEIVSPTVGSEQFARTDIATQTLTLGSASATAAPTDPAAPDFYACTWFSDVRNFGSGLRAYFQADFQQIGEGMTFTIADADKNPDTLRCGGAGQLLGYASKGQNAANAINYPKIGLEFDTKANAGYDEAQGELQTGRYDELVMGAGTPHNAFMFWGNSTANAAQPAVTQYSWDDNVHWMGGAGTDPRNTWNAALANGVKKMRGAGAGGIDKYVVRLDIARTRDAVNKRSTYTINAWIFAKNGEGSCYGGSIGSGAADLSDDFSNLFFLPLGCPTPMTQTITIHDDGDNEAFRTFRVGFTTGQSTTGQRILISGFKLRALP